ncbi:hypothetical protein Gorai_022866, partial [Gossypium raimondii]|nr:hypothetical protein [Gossypium raimondii]
MGNSVGDSTGRFANKVRHRLNELLDSDDSVGNDKGMKVDSEDDFELLESDAKKEIVNGIPTITFSEPVHQFITKQMAKAALQVIDFDNNYFSMNFQNDDDYLEMLSGGPQSGLPKGLYTKSLLKFIGRAIRPITKIDRNTDNYTMGQFVRLTIYIDLGKPLISKPEDVPKRALNGNHGKGASMQRTVGEEKFGPWMVVEYRQRRNSRSGVKTKDASGDRKAEESRFTVLSENHEGKKDDGLNAIKDNEGNRYSRTVIAYQNFLGNLENVTSIKSKRSMGENVGQQPSAWPSNLGKQIFQERDAILKGDSSSLPVKLAIDGIIHGLIQEIQEDTTDLEEAMEVNRCVDKTLEDNCQGCGHPRFCNSIKEYKREFEPNLLALFETRIGGSKADSINDNLSVEVLKVNSHFVHMRIQIRQNHSSFLCTVIHASPQWISREVLWDNLGVIAAGVEEPWIMAGDFNAILSCKKREGSMYTWNRGNLSQRLDRDFCNDHWQNFASNTSVFHLHKLKSDHRLLLVSVNQTRKGSGKIPFRFLANWLSHLEFRNVVANRTLMRRKKNRIEALKIEGSNCCCDDETLKHHDIDHFSKLYTVDAYFPKDFPIKGCFSKLEVDLMGSLNAEISMEEDVVGRSVFNMARKVFMRGSLDPNINRTPLVLILKGIGADTKILEPLMLSRRGPGLSHLFFVDDLLLFCKADEKGKYLGVPLFRNRVGVNTFQFVLDKVRNRLNGWDVRKLSLARRLTLSICDGRLVNFWNNVWVRDVGLLKRKYIGQVEIDETIRVCDVGTKQWFAVELQ